MEKKTTDFDKKKRKRNMLIGICIAVVLGFISYLLLEKPELFIGEEEKKITSMYSDELYSYTFYPAKYDIDVTEDRRYMELDRSIHYKNGAVTVMVTEEELGSYNAAVQFFDTYFKTVVKGDADTYNTFFTDFYYETNEPYVAFAPQKLYDIEIEQLNEKSEDSGLVRWTFNVKYKIHRNNGTFRNDIDSDASKKLCFELIRDLYGNVKINAISYYKSNKG